MFWALLAGFLLKQSPATQSAVLGLSTGLFITASAEANNREPTVSSLLLLVLLWGCVAGAAYYAGFAYQARRGATAEDRTAPKWLYMLYAIVWLLGLLAALLTLFGEGGLTVAFLTIVPLVLIAPTAMYGIRMTLHRHPA